MFRLFHTLRWTSILSIAACLHRPALSTDAAAELQAWAQPPSQAGTRIYEGAVHAQSGPAPQIFRYERWVSTHGALQQSVHITYDMDHTPTVLHVAEHTADYQLRSFREVHAQSGVVGQVQVDSSGSARFERTDTRRTRTRTEPAGPPVHVGPTLIGHIHTHWDGLAAGEVHPIRFVVMKDQRSYRFHLRAVDGPDRTQCFELVPAHVWVALAVPVLRLTFSEDRTLLEYAGRVPPLEPRGRSFRPLDATVQYTPTAPHYR